MYCQVYQIIENKKRFLKKKSKNLKILENVVKFPKKRNFSGNVLLNIPKNWKFKKKWGDNFIKNQEISKKYSVKLIKKLNFLKFC